ncbi:hypothetical protein OS493_032889 [Desmophyllum pertusum]|uniref:Apple domain-containing protein n=1 Tax=Desmophyllum pertusum TaxID=174260 RepID=A0A9W9YJ52_9CNID|nr:hypothetical protein OS493_032889 [Desmophyllum pertusum]
MLLNVTGATFVLLVCACCVTAFSMTTCPRQEHCDDVGYSFTLGKNMKDKYALRDYVNARFTVSGPMECFDKCPQNCRCISFNYRTTKNEHNCELNTENRHLKPSYLQPDPGAQYYDLVIDYNAVVRWNILFIA